MDGWLDGWLGMDGWMDEIYDLYFIRAIKPDRKDKQVRHR